MKNKKKGMRRATKNFYLILSLILLIFSATNLFFIFSEESFIKKKKEIYSYRSNFKYDYTVNLIDNKYINKGKLDMSQPAYVTDLIDTTDFNLNYLYEGSKETEVNYSYEVISKLEAVYTRDGEEQKVWEKEEILTPKKNGKSEDGIVKIDENINLDLKPANKLVKDFEQTMGMSLDAKYTISLNVNTDTVVEDEKVESKFQTQIYIDLAKKTTKIIGENNKENSQHITKEYEEIKERNDTEITIYISLAVASLLLFIIIAVTKTANIVRNKYREELNKILRLCQDKIVKLNAKPNIDEENIVEVKDFGEIIKVSEELFKPILLWDSEEDEAWFIVMSGGVSYRYILK